MTIVNVYFFGYIFCVLAIGGGNSLSSLIVVRYKFGTHDAVGL